MKDRGKTPTLQRRGRRPRKIDGKVRQKAYQSPSQVRSSASASASEKKTKAATTFVKDPRVPTSLSSSSAKMKKRKKKKKEEEATFVKDRGKSATSRRWRQRRRGGEPRRDQNLSKGRSSASASEKKKTEEVAVVKDRGKPCVAVQARGRRGSMTVAKYHGSRKRRGEGCEGVVMASRNEASEWPGVGAPHHRRSSSTVLHGAGEASPVIFVVNGCCV